jgi:hypothetical protein
MVFEGKEWMPANPVSMPHHHATRLALTNTAAFPVLTTHQDKRLRVTVEILSREIHQVSDRAEP